MTKTKQTSTPADPIGAARRRRRRLVHVALVVLGGVIFVDALVGDQGVLATLQARRDYEQVQALLNEARAENAWLRERAQQLRDDPDAIEDLARRELGLLRPGEKLFVVRNAGPADDSIR